MSAQDEGAGKRRVVLVEDNPDHALFIKRALSGDSVELIHFTDGEQASTYFSKTAPQEIPALILLDVNLPKRNGFELLQQIKAHETLKLVPVTMLSTTTQPSEIERAYRMGANAFVNKPVDFKMFTARVQTIKTFWLDVSLLPQKRAA